MDDDVILETGTSLSIEAGGVHITMCTSAALTPELADHMLTRLARQLVTVSRELGYVAADDDAES